MDYQVDAAGRGPKKLQGLLTNVDSVLRVFGSWMMISIMVIVSADVFARYLFSSPFSWSYDLISVYLMPGVFFLFLSDTFQQNGHVAVDIVQHRMRPIWRHGSLAISYACAVVVFGLILWVSVDRAWQSFSVGEVLAGGIAWPVWVAAAFVPVGVGMLLVRLLLGVVGHSLSVLAGRSVVPLPPLSGSEEAIL